MGQLFPRILLPCSTLLAWENRRSLACVHQLHPPPTRTRCFHLRGTPPHRWRRAEGGHTVGQHAPAPSSHILSHYNSPTPGRRVRLAAELSSGLPPSALPQHLLGENPDVPPSTETYPFRSKCIREEFSHGDVPSFPSVRTTVLNIACTFQTLASPEKIARANYKKKNTTQKPQEKNKWKWVTNKKQRNKEMLKQSLLRIRLFCCLTYTINSNSYQ